MDALSELLSLSTEKQETLGLKHTLAEIVQQPQTWLHTYRKIVSLSEPLDAFLSRLGIKSNQSTTPPAVLLVGAGTSDYIGRSVCSLLQNEWCCDVHATPSTDLLTNMPEHVIPCREYLWISFSRSGDSSEGVAVLEAALRDHPRIKHLVITCNAQGRMASAFDRDNVFRIVLDDDVNDRGLAMTSSFSNMVIAAQAVAHWRGLLSYGRIVESLAASASAILPNAANISKRLVQEGFSKVCFLGTGSLKGAAIESGLKVLELTSGRITTLAESFLGLRHGPMSAIDSETLMVAFFSADARRRQYELDLIQEICDKGLTSKFLAVEPNVEKTLMISPENTLSLGLQKDVSDLYLTPVAVIVGQLLGLFASLKEGLRPDNPSPKGAIGRVVGHVQLH
jgi:tagatose-6-phosphate ketose/aldose isomerase